MNNVVFVIVHRGFVAVRKRFCKVEAQCYACVRVRVKKECEGDIPFLIIVTVCSFARITTIHGGGAGCDLLSDSVATT